MGSSSSPAPATAAAAPINLRVSNHSYGFGSKQGARVAFAYDLNDHWQYGGSLDYLAATTPLRPEAGTQDRFRQKKEPATYSYDPSLSPQLQWTGKAERLSFKVPTLPLFIHERLSTKAILDGIRHRKAKGLSLDLFGDPEMDIRDQLEAYEHKGPWQNRMILGDSLQVMASLAEREGLRGKVQCIYFDPPYGIKFNSNFQWSTTSRDVKDGNADHITREPEQVKAFRDTWRDGIHSYLTYLRDRLTVARDLLTESGSIFVQIGDENVHRVRSVMDEVFGDIL